MTGAVSGAFWNFDNPLKPWGIIDRKSKLDIAFDWSDWLADIDDTIISWRIDADDPIIVLSSSENDGVVVAFINMNEAPLSGTKLKVRCYITTANSPTEREDPRTVYLKVIDR